MKKLYLIFVLPFFFFSANSQIDFSLEKFSSAKKMNKKVVEITPNYFVKHNVKHLQIIECIAEINIDDNVKNLAFNSSNDFSGTYKSKYPEYSKTIGEDYFETALDVLYSRFNKMLSDNGLSSTEKKNVISNPIYVKNDLQKTNFSEYDGSEIAKFFDNTKNIISSSCMKPLPNDLDYNAAEDFNQELAKIANDNAVNAALKIHIGITIDGEGVIHLTKYDVLMDTWLSAYKKGNETKYKWKLIDTELFKLKSEIKGSEYHKDLNSLDTELINIFDTITEMYSFVLSSYL